MDLFLTDLLNIVDKQMMDMYIDSFITVAFLAGLITMPKIVNELVYIFYLHVC